MSRPNKNPKLLLVCDPYDERLSEADPNPGVLSFQREAQPEISAWQVTREVADSMGRDVQLFDDPFRRPKPGDEVIRANAQKACANCPGHCCLAFWLGFKKSDIPRMLKERRQKAMELLERMERHDNVVFFHTGKYPEPKLVDSLEADNLLNEIRTLEFFQHRLIPRRYNGESDDRKQMRRGGRRQYLYGCTAFDPVARRCTQYENRPRLCRQYVCGPATAGFPPRADSMQTKHVPALAVTINATGEV